MRIRLSELRSIIKNILHESLQEAADLKNLETGSNDVEQFNTVLNSVIKRYAETIEKTTNLSYMPKSIVNEIKRLRDLSTQDKEKFAKEIKSASWILSDPRPTKQFAFEHLLREIPELYEKILEDVVYTAILRNQKPIRNSLNYMSEKYPETVKEDAAEQFSKFVDSLHDTINSGERQKGNWSWLPDKSMRDNFIKNLKETAGKHLDIRKVSEMLAEQHNGGFQTSLSDFDSFVKSHDLVVLANLKSEL